MDFFKKKPKIPERREQEFIQRIKQALTEKIKRVECELESNTHFKEDLNFDSLDSIEAVMALEEEFNIEISDEDAEKFLTVADVVEYLYIKLEK
jgi:acyl carrier protein